MGNLTKEGVLTKIRQSHKVRTGAMAKFCLCSLLMISTLWASFVQGINQEAIGKEPRYSSWPRLGLGTYGCVHLFGDRAVKIGVLKDESQCSKNILEAAIYKALKNPSMPKILSIMIHRGKFDNFLEIHMPIFSPSKADNFSDALEQVAAVLSLAHAHNIANRDIKKQHLMMSGRSVVVIDWGMADIFTASPIDQRGTTLAYCSPEVLLANFTNPKENDMWAFGVSLLELANCLERLFPQDKELDVLNSVFANPITSISLKSLVDSCKNGDQRLSDKLLKLVEQITCPLQKKSVKNMLQPFSADRIRAQQLQGNSNAAGQPSSIALLPQPIFREHSQINPRMREMTYLWLCELTVEFQHPSKFLFEAMSIADRFIETTDLTPKNLQLAASIAYYLAEDFYEDGHTINIFVDYAAGAFSAEQFRELMLTLLENADFNLIFNHSLRAYQEQIYRGDMSHHERGVALLLLFMLEIDSKNYTKSNLEKWQLVDAVVSHLRGAPISTEHRSIWHEICRHFSNSFLSKRSYYFQLCESAQ